MELQDAAYIDGANHWQIFWNIILPSVKPSLATVALFTFMGNWNAFIGPLIYLDSPQKQTLALGMYTFLSNHDTNEGAIIALTIMMALPLIIIFFLMQKLFIQGISLTGTTK